MKKKPDKEKKEGWIDDETKSDFKETLNDVAQCVIPFGFFLLLWLAWSFLSKLNMW